MYIRKDNSPQLGPIWSLIGGGMLLVAGSSLDILCLLALWSGQIWRFSKRHPGLVIRSEHPGHYWLSFVSSLVFGSVLLYLSTQILKDGWKKRCAKGKNEPGA
jgi:hypothetical protein